MVTPQILQFHSEIGEASLLHKACDLQDTCASGADNRAMPGLSRTAGPHSSRPAPSLPRWFVEVVELGPLESGRSNGPCPGKRCSSEVIHQEKRWAFPDPAQAGGRVGVEQPAPAFPVEGDQCLRQEMRRPPPPGSGPSRRWAARCGPRRPSETAGRSRLSMTKPRIGVMPFSKIGPDCSDEPSVPKRTDSSSQIRRPTNCRAARRLDLKVQTAYTGRA